MTGWANEFIHARNKERMCSSSRRRCVCCNRRATHVGTANGIALMEGCELLVSRWVKGGSSANARVIELRQQNQ